MSVKLEAEESTPLQRLESTNSSESSSTNDAFSDYEWRDHAQLGAEKGYRLTRFPKQITWPRWCRQSPRHRHSLLTSTLTLGRKRRSIQVRILQALLLAPCFIASTFLWFSVAAPGYTWAPNHYNELRKRVETADALGRANIHNEKVFIAASIYEKNGEMLFGDWGDNLRELIDILGPDNVFLSIYENDPDEQTKRAMSRFPGLVTCNTSIVHEHLDLCELPHAITPTGELKLKRIALLAEVRNRALRPLDDRTSPAYATRFDKLLYLNDVVFDPIDAANLLFSTNMDLTTTRSDYLAACAVDFANPVKFYDTFATRDIEGYRMGIPIYPWFTTSGESESRSAVIKQRDNVPVKSCWGGMVAFQAKWFQPHAHQGLLPLISSNTSATNIFPDRTAALRFRFEPDTYWDASECCLIHADLAYLSTQPGATAAIYMNPYIRVAYTTTTLRWLRFTRRFERPLQWIQQAINALAHLPTYNPHRTQQPGDHVVNKEWVWDAESEQLLRAGNTSDLAGRLHATMQNVERIATPGQFCGDNRLRFIHETPKAGQARWGVEQAPWPVDIGLSRRR